MQRKKFLKTIFGASLLMSMDGFSSIAHIMSNTNIKTEFENKNSSRFASFGAIHLNITNLEKSSLFWTEVVGMKLRKTSEHSAEFGTEQKTLVVLHQIANASYKKGFSGLYHVAIHAPTKQAFASMYHRLIVNKYPNSPVDHTMSKSFYLEDPDGITIEFTLETPERLKRVITNRGIQIEDVNGVIRSASDHLDVKEVLKDLVETDLSKTIAEGTFIGHLHLYVNNLTAANNFYKSIGFIDFNYLPDLMYSDVGAGGEYKHRIAMNTWHGINRPLAPNGSAGMNHFKIIYNSTERLENALKNVSQYEEKEGDFWTTDPTGNRLVLTWE